MRAIDHGCSVRTLPLLLAASFGAASLAQAQGVALEEVVITAQKRKENLQDVPISVQALDAKALEKSGVVVLADVKSFVPGLTVDTYPGSSEMLYPSIRGIVPNSIQTSVPIPMAIHVDGVALTQLAGLNLAGADLERIEVLKGPQGVLAGRNATGGAINIVTAKPELGQFGFKQQFTVAERGQFLSKTVVNAPFTDNFAAKLSYWGSRILRQAAAISARRTPIPCALTCAGAPVPTSWWTMATTVPKPIRSICPTNAWYLLAPPLSCPIWPRSTAAFHR